jgi:hypothetical protein
MDEPTFDLDNPSDYKRLRDLVAPTLARYEQTGPPSARLEAGSRDDVPSKVPSTLLPSRYGDLSKWTPAEQQYNDDMRNLLIDAESRPFASAAQRTAAMVDVMLRHPTVFAASRRVDGLLTEDKGLAGSPKYVLRTSLPWIFDWRLIYDSAALPGHASMGTNLSSVLDRKDESHLQATFVDPGDVGKTDGGKEHPLSRIIGKLDTVLQTRSLIQQQMSKGLPQNSQPSKKRHLENRYILNLRRHLGQNNSTLAQGGVPGKFAGTIAKCKTDQSRKCKQEILSNSIDIQIVLGELIAETKGREVAMQLMSFVRASVEDKWSAAYSDAYEVELVMRAEKASAKIKALLGDDLQTANATHEIPESTRPSSVLLKSFVGQVVVSMEPAAQTQLATYATAASRASSDRAPGDEERPNESPRNGAEPAASTSKIPLHGYTHDTQPSTPPGNSMIGHPSSARTKGDVMFYLELEGSADYPQQLRFIEHHDRDQFFQGVSKMFKGRDVKSVTVTISSLPTSSAPDAPDLSYRTWKYNVGRGDAGISAWAVLRSDLVKILHGPQKSYETVVVKALVYWR